MDAWAARKFSPGVRGWTESAASPLLFPSRFSPGVRGWTVVVVARCSQRRFPPACGGGPLRCDGTVAAGSFPPACGGGPRYGLIGRLFVAFSPGVRGWTGRDRQAAAIGDVFPRRAGVDRDMD